MSGTALGHRLVRAYLRELDAAMRGVPAAQAREPESRSPRTWRTPLGPMPAIRRLPRP